MEDRHAWLRLVAVGDRRGRCSTWNMARPPDGVRTTWPFDVGGGRVFHVEHRGWEVPFVSRGPVPKLLEEGGLQGGEVVIQASPPAVLPVGNVRNNGF